MAMRGSQHHRGRKGLQNARELRIRVAESTCASKIALAVLAPLLLVACIALAACVDPAGERPAAAPSPSPSRTPDAAAVPLVSARAMPTPSPAPEPDREPHDYRVEDLEFSTVAKTPKFHEVEFTARIVNHGGHEGLIPIAVEASLDGGERETVKVIDRAIAGADATVTVIRSLGPGTHRFELAVGGAVESISFEVAAADLEVNIGPYRKTERSGWVTVPVMISNRGGATAEFVQIYGTLQPVPYPTHAIATEVGTLAPGATKTVEIRVRPVAFPVGQRLHITAGSRSLESDPANNSAERGFTILLDHLSIDVSQLPGITYVKQRAQTRFRFSVDNSGRSPSGEFWAGFLDRGAVGSLSELSEAIEGLPQCSAELSSACWWGNKSTSIDVGERRLIDVIVPLDAGAHELIAFVGGPGYRAPLQDNMITELNVVVPPQPAVTILADLRANVRGYWSDGTANVEVVASITNVGYRKLEGAQRVELACRRPQVLELRCQHAASIEFADGFGPAEFRTTVRVPMGEPTEFVLSAGESRLAAFLFAVPERVLAVDRYIWDCYRSRGGSDVWTSIGPIGCSGWLTDGVSKWWQDRPVTVWSTGRPEYRAVLASVLDEFEPLLNLEFQHVADKADADLRAYVGVPGASAVEAGLGEYCTKAGGCASWDVDHATGIIRSGVIGAWHFERTALPSQFIKAIAHEVLHAMLGIYHRPTFDALLGAPVSVSDVALIRLNSDPLIEPGLTMAQVRNLIVLNDELLDPAPTSPYETIWRASLKFQQAGSAKFSLSGDWIGNGCEFGSIAPSIYEVAGFLPDQPRLARLSTGDQHFWHVDGRYWEFSNDEWVPITEHDVAAQSGWLHRLTDPISLLHAASAYGSAETFAVSESDSSMQILTGDSVPVPGSWHPITDAALLLDPESLALVGYEMTRSISETCSLRLKSVDGEYGAAPDLPQAISMLN